MEYILPIFIGLGLSAACGLRIFIPFLIINLASSSGYISLSPDFAWLSTKVALITFSVATIIEIGSYYIPWIDNLLDTIAVPASVVAGTIITASFITDMNPFLSWTLALISGGAVSGVINTGTSVLRLGSSTLSAGLTNHLLSTFENILSVIVALMSIFLPFITIFLVLLILSFSLKRIINLKNIVKN